MAILDILEFPDPRLRTKAKPVTKVDDKIRKLTDDMLETMYEAPGIGLAATQVNVHQRIVVIDVSEEKDQPLVLINPEYEVISGEQDFDEGCLSVPGYYETVTRAETIKLKALNREGEPFEMECNGILSVCIQHELDHLDGKLFVDHISKLKRERIRKKLVKEQKDRVKVR
ncbi:MAG: peptide deformylase [Pseudomonadales bacterium]|jgi:peptide deformylase|nr:peptide deformylase [Pseudomonadales bacterium]MCK5789975.1 peptide deformylase [Ketobacter sp.]MEC8812608.1 peptide deformylase [Pseudomonadota bacterium]HAG94738.1 peptide deformylase [Gammaproteobacteria bacterium]MAQ25158.1 peptide deformylase [Pseudomonadales bacterium]|tara:strand:- start:577 stop:1089 length:513 start_codon:yes stop_codon:yes gene_type:complete